jgi:hypothetical protein
VVAAFAGKRLDYGSFDQSSVDTGWQGGPSNGGPVVVEAITPINKTLRSESHPKSFE